MRPSYGGPDFSVSGLRASLEASLRRLKTDYVDLLQLHNPIARSVLPPAEVLPLLARLRVEGKIRAYGISAKSPADALEFVAAPGLASLQVNLNLLDWRAFDCGLVARAQKAGIAIIARTPLAFGFLAGSIKRGQTFAPDDHRSRLSRRQIENWADAAAEMQAELHAIAPDLGPTEAALRFCLSIAGVATVIPGMMTCHEVLQNTNADTAPHFSLDQLKRLEALYRRHEANLVLDPASRRDRPV